MSDFELTGGAKAAGRSERRANRVAVLKAAAGCLAAAGLFSLAGVAVAGFAGLPLWTGPLLACFVVAMAAEANN